MLMVDPLHPENFYHTLYGGLGAPIKTAHQQLLPDDDTEMLALKELHGLNTPAHALDDDVFDAIHFGKQADVDAFSEALRTSEPPSRFVETDPFEKPTAPMRDPFEPLEHGQLKSPSLDDWQALAPKRGDGLEDRHHKLNAAQQLVGTEMANLDAMVAAIDPNDSFGLKAYDPQAILHDLPLIGMIGADIGASAGGDGGGSGGGAGGGAAA